MHWSIHQINIYKQCCNNALARNGFYGELVTHHMCLNMSAKKSISSPTVLFPYCYFPLIVSIWLNSDPRSALYFSIVATAPHEATIEKYGADRGSEFNQIAGCHLDLSIITYLSWVSSHTSSGGSVSVRQSLHDNGRPLQWSLEKKSYNNVQ